MLPHDIRDGMAANLAHVPGLHVYPYLSAKPELPAAVIHLTRVDYDLSHSRGLDRYEFEIMLLVAIGDDRAAQREIDQYLAPTGDTSIKAMIESDRNLNGIISDMRVTQATGIREFTVNDLTALGCTFQVEVYAPGS